MFQEFFMPAIYAHDKFGRAVIAALPHPLKETLLAYPSALRLGFQGPDVLFYHKPLKTENNPTRKKGVDMHHTLADTFFIEQAKTLSKEGIAPSPYLSYIGGFLCHYLLDFHLHPSIYEVEATGVSHGKIESEFDKFLLKKDELPYRGMNTAAVYTQGAGTDLAVEKALGVTNEQANRAIKTMKKYNGLFALNCELVHAVCHGALKLVKKDKKFGDMFRRKKDDEACLAASETLSKLLEKAIPVAAEKVEGYFANLQEIASTEKMDEIFHENYTGGIF